MNRARVRAFVSREVKGQGWFVFDFATRRPLAGPFKGGRDGGRGTCLSAELQLRIDQRRSRIC